MSSVFVVFRKEMRELLRDIRTLILVVLLPLIIGPAVICGLVTAMARMMDKTASEVLTCAVLGDADLPYLSGVFEGHKNYRRIPVANLEELVSKVKNNKVNIGLHFPDMSRDRIERGQQVKVVLYYKQGLKFSDIQQRASKIIDEYNSEILRQRLSAFGLNHSEQQAFIYPISVERHDTTDMRHFLGGRIGGIIPYLFVVFCFLAGVPPAVDMGAGEKERDTLETLLLTPVPHFHIALGKFLAVFTTSTASALLTLFGLGLALFLSLKNLSMPKEIVSFIIGSLGYNVYVIGAILLIPMSAIFSSVLICISIFSRSVKEAGSYCGPGTIVAMMFAFVSILPFVKLNGFWAIIPISNVSLAFREVFKGSMDYGLLVVICGVNIMTAVGLLVFSAFWFKRETVLFRK